jgi:hypothetical protein
VISGWAVVVLNLLGFETLNDLEEPGEIHLPHAPIVNKPEPGKKWNTICLLQPINGMDPDMGRREICMGTRAKASSLQGNVIPFLKGGGSPFKPDNYWPVEVLPMPSEFMRWAPLFDSQPDAGMAHLFDNLTKTRDVSFVLGIIFKGGVPRIHAWANIDGVHYDPAGREHTSPPGQISEYFLVFEMQADFLAMYHLITGRTGLASTLLHIYNKHYSPPDC